MNTRYFLISALIAGVVIGLLGNLPLLNLVNCILCLWVWLGGILAVWLYRRYQRGGAGLSIAQGAGLGALSGLIGALVGVVVFAITSSVTMPLMNSLAQALQIEGDLPFQSGGIGAIVSQAIFFLILDLVLYPIFGAIGGLIAASLFWKKPQATVG
jgi:hypothetical protein